MNLRRAAILMASAMIFSGQVQAASVVVDATSSGFCRSDGFNNGNAIVGCNYDPQDPLQNNFAGIIGDGEVLEHRNFFGFALPVGPVTDAVLSIFNDGRNFTQQPGTDYTVKGISTISYSTIGSGTTYGSINVGAADTGVSHYVDIILNSAAITQLNANAGGSILFGGSVNGTNASANQLFGYVVGGRPAYLTLSNNAVTSSVPEPATWAMMMLGFAFVGFAMRKRSNVRTRVIYA